MISRTNFSKGHTNSMDACSLSCCKKDRGLNKPLYIFSLQSTQTISTKLKSQNLHENPYFAGSFCLQTEQKYPSPAVLCPEVFSNEPNFSSTLSNS